MKVLNTAIPAGLSIPTGKVGREWTKVYIDNLGEFLELMRVDTMRYEFGGGTMECAVTDANIRWVRWWVRWQDLKVKLLSNGVVVAKGKLPC